MRLESFFDKFELITDAPYAVGRMRELVRHLAITGRLVSRNRNDEPASDLLRRIECEMTAEQRHRRGAPLAPLLAESQQYELPENWTWARFRDVAIIASNLVQPSGFLDFIHLAPDNIEKGNGVLLPCRTVREDKVISANHRFYAGQIIYSKIRPNLAKVVLVDFEGLCSADMYPIDALIDASYLQLYMLSESFLVQAVKTDTRVAMPKINQTELNAIAVPVPPLAEQKRIVAKVNELMAFCDRLEAQQQERETRHAALARASLSRFADAPTPSNLNLLFHKSYDIAPADLRKSILTLAVQGKLVSQDPNDEPAAEILASGTDLPQGHIRRRKIMKRSPVASKAEMFPDLPPSWEYADVQRLYDLNLIVDYADGNHGSLYPRSSEFGASGVRFVTARDIANGRVSWNSCALLNEGRAHQLTKGWAQGGDVLLTHNATVGRVARTERDAGRYLLGTSVTFYRLNEEFVDSIYFYHVLCSPLWQGQLEAVMQQTTRNQVSIQKQAFFRVPIPPIAEQRRIVGKVEQLMRLVDALEAQLAASHATATNLLAAAVAELK